MISTTHFNFCCHFVASLVVRTAVRSDVVLMFIVSLLISRSGDIEPNPGPPLNSNSLNSSFDSYAALTNSGLSIMNLNIQSLKPKMDILAVEAQLYDVLVFTETWLPSKYSDEDVHIPNFKKPFRCDRNDRLGGWCCYLCS